MSAVTWKEQRAFEWVAADNSGRIVGKVARNVTDSLYTVTQPDCAAGEYLNLEYAQAAVERATRSH